MYLASLLIIVAILVFYNEIDGKMSIAEYVLLAIAFVAIVRSAYNYIKIDKIGEGFVSNNSYKKHKQNTYDDEIMIMNSEDSKDYFDTDEIDNSDNLKKNNYNSDEEFNNIRNSVRDVSEEIFGRALNITLPIIQLFIISKDILGKVLGTLTASLYTFMGSYMAMMALFGAIYSILLKVLIVLISIIVIALATFNFGTAAVTVAIATPIMIFLIPLLKLLKEALNISGLRGVPKVPHCFDENVKVHMKDGSSKKFSEVQINDVLSDGSCVTSFMKMTSADHTMYTLRGIVVTGSHKVFHEEKGWILYFPHRLI